MITFKKLSEFAKEEKNYSFYGTEKVGKRCLKETSKIRERLEQTPGERRVFLEQQKPGGGRSMLCSRSNEEVDTEEEWVVSIQCSGQLADHVGEYLAGLETLRLGP